MSEINQDYTNRIIHCDCVEGMHRLPVACIPLTLTSPPYDAIRHYGGHRFDQAKFREIAEELFRITMPGGVVVWVVQEQIRDGSETGTSSRQRLYFQETGFRLFQTLVMSKKGTRSPAGGVRYGGVPLEFAFILSKGKPRSINLIRDKPNRHAGMLSHYSFRKQDGTLHRDEGKPIAPLGVRSAVWEYPAGRHTAEERFAYEHPALMPEAMAQDLIISWSRPGDLVFDPMCGAGTTCKMALLNNRRYLGMEIVERYCEIARERVRLAQAVLEGGLREYGVT